VVEEYPQSLGRRQIRLGCRGGHESAFVEPLGQLCQNRHDIR
jgi:hypothetical protein